MKGCVLFAVCGLIAAPAARAAVPSDIVALSREAAESRSAVSVTGVVTLAAAWLPTSGILADAASPNGTGVFFAGSGKGCPDVDCLGFGTLASGDVIAIRGHVDPLLAEPGVVATSIERLAHVTLPPPPRVSVAALNDRRWANRRARIRGWVRGIRSRPTQTGAIHSVELDTGAGSVTVSTGRDALCDPKLVGELVDIDGVFLHVIRIGGELLSIELEADSPSAIRPVGAWTRRWAAACRLMRTAGLYFLVPLLAGVVWLLHEKRATRARNAALSEERRRIAGELHDTVAQHISGAKMMLCSMRRGDAAHGEEYAMIGGTLEAAWREVRDAIYGLKNDELMAKGLGEILAAYAEKTNALGGVRVETDVRDAPDFAVRVKIDLLAIVQEAVGNAARHGGARHVAVSGRRNADGKLVLTISNDGAPFDAARAPGPEAGHFGLSGMRERAARSGFAFAVGADGGGKAEVRLEERA